MPVALAIAAFFWMTVAGLAFWDRLILPGFLGLCFALGLAVWQTDRPARERYGLWLEDPISREPRPDVEGTTYDERRRAA